MPARLLPAVLLLLASSAAAQITTDRPGFGFSPDVVGARVFQVEAGTPEATLDSGADTYAVPVALRYGLAPAVEVRLATSVLDGVQGEGVSDLDLGFRSLTAGLKLAVPTDAVTLALIPEFVIPTEGGGDVVFQINAPAAVSLGAVDLTLVPGLVTGGGSTQLNAVAVLSGSLGGALSGYAEAVALPTLDGAGGTPAYLGAGLAVLLNEDTQLDAFFDAGITDAAPTVLLGVGVSFRID